MERQGKSFDHSFRHRGVSLKLSMQKLNSIFSHYDSEWSHSSTSRSSTVIEICKNQLFRLSFKYVSSHNSFSYNRIRVETGVSHGMCERCRNRWSFNGICQPLCDRVLIQEIISGVQPENCNVHKYVKALWTSSVKLRFKTRRLQDDETARTMDGNL